MENSIANQGGRVYTKDMLDKYLKNDWILNMLLELEQPEDNNFRTHQWLKEMDNKRMIYADMYGDLLTPPRGKLKILDVGGGYTSLTKKLAEYHEYTLLDFMAHGQKVQLVRIFDNGNYSANILIDDWYNVCEQTTYDIVIANDIFPAADQRMEIFIDRYLPLCRELRLQLPFYNNPKFYTTKRIDDSEIFTFLSYDGEIVGLKLKKYLDRINMTLEEIDSLKNIKESIYYNGRQVCYVIIKGDIS